MKALKLMQKCKCRPYVPLLYTFSLRIAKILLDPGRAAVAHEIVDQFGMVVADQQVVVGQGSAQEIADRFMQLQADLGAAQAGLGPAGQNVGT